MAYRGVVKNGVVVFNGKKPKEGTAVTITTRRSRAARKPATVKPKTLAEGLAPFIGMADDLPGDMSKQHDHYLYGTPKKK